MKKVGYSLALIGTIVLVSLRGGHIPYLLFYFMLFLPLLALVYSVYVYLRFKIVQEVERTVVKSQKVPYRLILVNEDWVPFTNITLHYFSDMVSIKEPAGGGMESAREKTRNLCLLSKESIRVDTEMYCKYRGTYPVGVKSVSVTDFLGLFTITYPMKSQVRLTARPRLIPLEKLTAGLQERDPKNSLFSTAKLQELPDFECRRYQAGDSRKYIHWKNSAKAGELLVRKQMPEELFEIAVIMDLTPVRTERENLTAWEQREIRMQTEDKIIETGLSFVHDYYLKKIPVRAIYAQQDVREILIEGRNSFETFYDDCTNVVFDSKLPFHALWETYVRKGAGCRAAILITSSADDSLRRKAEEGCRIGIETVLIDVEELSI